jgi:hypothetical protein
MGTLIDLTGQKFGRLTVIKLDHIERKSYWLCKCDCGKETISTSGDLKSGHKKSCGCLHDELSSIRLTKRNLTHGESNTRLYKIWTDIKKRCYRETFWAYSRYGGRGITLCQEWHDYPTFRDWCMSNGYAENLTIDRINNDGNYEPNNCRWVDRKTQSNNKSNVRTITYNGETKTIAQWAETLGINYQTLYNRIFDYNIPIEEALTNKKYSIGKRG